ncbi:family 16 glycosylhydrolase [Demequina sp. NBRC 110051]|uniref:glycoside hydrolase family 16 protein n=1 Tax=Demequina sp. NBRC 110051 TaxID=1570340 RepID=UPI000A019426|nr:glycoside hydrolase family 16 protein [Demequina sp. NBRC 110051]
MNGAPPARSRGRRTVILVAVVAVLLAVATVVWWLGRAGPPTDIAVTASSTLPGTSAQALVERARATPAPSVSAATAPVRATRTATWASDGETSGAWVRLTWAEPTAVSRIRIDGAGGSYTSAVVEFDDGSAVHVTPDGDGDVLVDIEERTARTATLRFASFAATATSVGLHAFLIDDGGAEVRQPSGATISSSSGAAAQVADGDIATGDTGATWVSTEADAWVAYSWDTPVAIASVQVAARDQNSTGATLHFGDGSSVPIAGIGPDPPPVTTVAFTPRTVTSVRLELDSPTTLVEEFVPYGSESTPPVWPVSDGLAVTAVDGAECSAPAAINKASVSPPLSLVCPPVGARVGPEATIVVAGPPGQVVSATAWLSDDSGGAPGDVAASVVGSTGTATLTFSTTDLPHGPFAVRLDTPGAAAPLYVQLVNEAGEVVTAESTAPPGATVQFVEEFDSPLSVTWDGTGATYAGTKPAGDTGSEFGEAVFVDPAQGRELLAADEGWLRIRVAPLDGEDPWGWDRQFGSGLLSSTAVGGAGFSAQYGYFEARMLAPAGRGTWPAFWMLDTGSAVNPEGPAGEVDAVELYGHNPSGSCHSAHNWPAGSGDVTGTPCLEDNGHGDWALSWHTYGVRIRPGGAEYFIDGDHVATQDGLIRDSLPYFFMVNLALGGGWPVALDPTGGVADLYVDWIRVST